MYDDYGEWSCGRIWVKKTEAIWDSSQSYYGYLDDKGNLIGDWHLVQDRDNSYADYHNKEDYDNSDTTMWKKPYDFKNNYAFILKAHIRHDNNLMGGYGGSCFDIININGDVISSIYCHEERLIEYNEWGYAYFVGEDYFISEDPITDEETWFKDPIYILNKDGKAVRLL